MAAFQSVAAYVPAGAQMLSIALVLTVFGNNAHSEPMFDVVLAAERPGSVSTDIGMPLTVEQDLDRMADADLVLLLPGQSLDSNPSTAVTEAIRAAYQRGAIIACHGMACFTLAATGLLDGARATTHWRLSAEFAARYPRVAIGRDVLYVDEGQLITSAGAVDLYLYLIRREHGASVANAVARQVVLPPQRDGSQLQYVEASPADSLTTMLSWAMANIHRPLPVETMAAKALMSERTFSRRFREVTGTTPHAWLLGRRLARAEVLLEETDLSVDEVARQVGYASGAVLREQFTKNRGLPPREYRRRFGGAAKRMRLAVDDPICSSDAVL